MLKIGGSGVSAFGIAGSSMLELIGGEASLGTPTSYEGVIVARCPLETGPVSAIDIDLTPVCSFVGSQLPCLLAEEVEPGFSSVAAIRISICPAAVLQR